MLTRILNPGDWFSYVSYLGDRAYSVQWTLYQGPAERGPDGAPRHRFLFLSETDVSRIGLAGPVQKIRAELLCRDDLFPVRYRVTTRDAVNIAHFDGEVKLILPDGSRKTLTPGPFRCVLGDNVGQLALLLRLACDEIGDVFRSAFFSLGGATRFEYELSFWKDERRGRWYRSNFDEELLIGPGGLLREHASPKDGARAVRESKPLPDWLEDPILRKPLQYRPPEPRSFALEDVGIAGPSGAIGASLTVPAGAAPFPIALFLSGSGSHDRHGFAGDIDLGSHEIMDGLAERGWMGLRCDTPGAGGTALGENFLERGLEETIADARAALEFLLRHPGADPNRCLLVGHSQGAVVAMELAVRDFSPKAVCLLAPPGRNARDVLADQIRVRGGWLGQSPEQVRRQIEELDEFVQLAARGDWNDQEIPARFVVHKRERKWFADVLRRDPIEMISRLSCPVLICQGKKDFQVSADKDAEPLAEAARAAGVPVRLEVFPNLDHLFKPVEGEAHLSHYYDSDRRVDPAVIEAIHAFAREAVA